MPINITCGKTVWDQRIELPAGDATTWRFTIESEPPSTLEGSTGRFVIARSVFGEPGEIVVEKSTSIGGGIEIVDEINSVLDVKFSGAETDGLSGLFRWELELVQEGKPLTAAMGRLYLLPTAIRNAVL